MTDDPTLGSRVRRALWKQAPRIIASLVIAGGFIWLFHRGGVPLVPERGAFAKLEPWATPAYALLIVLATYLRTHRWLYLLRPIAPDISERKVIGIGLVGMAAILFAPLRIGEAARPYLFGRDGKVSFFQALGASGAERVVDGLVLTLVTAAGLLTSTPVSPLPNHVGNMPVPVSAIPHAVFIALAVFSCAFVAITVFYFARDFAHRLTQRVLGVVSQKLADFVTSTLERLSDGLTFFSSPGNLGAFFRDTLLYWACVFGGQWLLIRGCGIPATPSEACVTLGVLGLGAVVPAGPGFFGAYQIAIYAGLALYYEQSVVVSSGAAIVFISYAVQLVLSALAGGLGFWMLRRGGAQPEASALRAARD